LQRESCKTVSGLPICNRTKLAGMMVADATVRVQQKESPGFHLSPGIQTTSVVDRRLGGWLARHSESALQS